VIGATVTLDIRNGAVASEHSHGPFLARRSKLVESDVALAILLATPPPLPKRATDRTRAAASNSPGSRVLLDLGPPISGDVPASVAHQGGTIPLRAPRSLVGCV
jgi:hypothetical protein